MKVAGDWLVMVALEHEALALARAIREVHPLAGKIHGILGRGFEGTGDYGRARELHEQYKATCGGAWGPRGGGKGVRQPRELLPTAWETTRRARELHEQ